MLKRLLLTVILLTSFFGGGILTISAENTAKAIWCADNKTLYFLYDDVDYNAGGTYDTQTITKVYSFPFNTSTPPYIVDVKSTCTHVVINENFKNFGLTNCSFMFYDLGELTSVTGLEYMITASTQNTRGMFHSCTKLASIDLSGTITSNITTMSSMFNNCKALTYIDLSKFTTDSATSMAEMFYNCQALNNIDISNFNTAKVTIMNGMFYGCQALTSLDLRNFDTSKVFTMKQMFQGCSNLTSLTLSSNFNTSAVNDMSYMFFGCNKLANIDLSSFNTSKVVDMQNMFNNCKALTSLDLSSFNTSIVTNMSNMFFGCDHLESLVVWPFNTSEVETLNMNSMFKECKVLTSLDLSNFDTSKVTDMADMFSGCELLRSLNVKSFNTSKVTTMAGMFYKCEKLTSLDLRSFNVNSVEYMGGMFTSDLELVTIYANSDWKHDGLLSANMFQYCNNLKGKTASYSYEKVTADYANPGDEGYFTAKVDMSFSSDSETATVGTAFTPPTVTTFPVVAVNYSSSNDAVATVDASTGAVTPITAGTINIIAKYAGEGFIPTSSASYQLTVNKGDATLTFAQAEVDGKVAETFTPSLTTTPNGLTVVYSTSNTDLATIDAASGVVTLKSEGQVTITATVDDGGYEGTASYKINISKNAHGLAFSEATATATYNTSFTPPTLTNPNSLSVTYESSEPTVATVADDGTVTLLKAGETTISAKFDGTNVYEAGSVSYELTVNKGTPALTFEKSEVDAKVGVDITPSLTVSPKGLTVVYSSSDTDLATVDAATGKVTPKAEGEVTITATVNDSKYEGSASYKMIITKNANGLAFSDDTETVAYDTNFTLQTLANPNNLTVTYESSEPTVATIDSDGKVTVLKVGETTISAKFAGNVAYEAGSVNYVLTVDPKTVSTPSITLSETSYTYDGNAKTPTVTVKDGEKVIPAEEYTVGYQANTNVGTATVTITDKEGGNYIVSGSATFSIASADGCLVPPAGVSGLTYSGAAQDLITAGSSTTGTMQYSLDGTTYIETIPQGTDAKEYTVYYKVVAKAGYKDVDPASFKVTIAPKIVSSPTITLSQTSYEYDGTAKEPTVTVKDGTTTIDAKEYTVSYKNNTEAGTATVVITDKEGGNYNVSGSITFEITAKDEPSTDDPSTDEPSTDEPSTDDPSTDDPSTDEPSTDEPSTDDPSTDDPSTDEPSTDDPSTDEPSTDEPSTDEPSTDDPSTDDPSTDDPSTDEPSIDEPTPDNVAIAISGAKQVPYFCEYNLDFTDKPELKAYVATGYDKAKGTIWLTRVKQVPAETGFLLMGEPGDYDIPTIDGVSDVYYKNMFKGTLTGTTIQTTDGEYTNYYLSKGTSGVGFYKVTNADGQSISANRCYLPILTDIPANGSEGDAEVIKVSAAKQVPYYTSKNIDFSSLEAQGVKAYTATGYNYKTGIIWLTRVKKVPAQTGILVMADKEGEYSVPTTSVQSVYENMFTGSETAQTIYTTEMVGDITYINYYLSNGTSGIGFYKVTKEDGVKMGANRSYLQIPKREKASGARGMSGNASFCKMIISDNDDDVIAIPIYGEGTTGIIESGITNPLQQEEVWYTLQGIRVDKPGKGLYIRNGKTVLIK